LKFNFGSEYIETNVYSFDNRYRWTQNGTVHNYGKIIHSVGINPAAINLN